MQQKTFYPMRITDVQQSLKQFADQEEIKLYEQYYRDLGFTDGLYVHCPVGTDHQLWLGVCWKCGVDHGEARKIRIKANVFQQIPGANKYNVLDMTSFIGKTSQIINYECSQLANNFPKEIILRDQDTIAQYIKSKSADVSKKLYQEIIKVTCIESYFKNLNFNEIPTKLLRCQCNDQKLYDWLGYCRECKQNPDGSHQFYLSYNKQNPPKQLDKYIRFKMVNQERLCLKIMQFFEHQLWTQLIWKAYSAAAEQQQVLVGQNQKSKLMEQEYKKMQEQREAHQQHLHGVQLQIVAKKNMIEQLKSEYQEKLQQKRIALFGKQQIEQKEDLYDVEIDCSSLLRLTIGDGWPVKTNQFYDKQKHNNTSVVTLYGLYNKGKSFLASKLSGKPLNSGYSVSTVGLSALYPRDMKTENSIVFLDTAGTETPISYHKQDDLYEKIGSDQKDENIREKMQFEIRLKDRLLTENLIQRFILRESNIILMIVDQLTKEEQKLVQKIKQNYGQSELIIVHNFAKLVNTADVEKYIKIDIENSFSNVEKQYRKFPDGNQGNVYLEERWDSGKEKKQQTITHVVMAQEGSEAGDHFNQFCVTYLKNRIINVLQIKKFDIIQKLIDAVREEIPQLIEAPGDKLNRFKLEYLNGFIKSDLECSNLKSITFDLLGDLRVYNGDLAPKHSLQVIKDENKLIMLVELSGWFQPLQTDLDPKLSKWMVECPESKCKLWEWHGFMKDKRQYISIRGRIIGARSDNLQSNDKKPNDERNDRKETGEFRLIEKVDPVQCVLKDSRPVFSYKGGIATFVFNLQKQYEPPMM